MKVDLKGLHQFFSQDEFSEFVRKAETAEHQLVAGTGLGAEFTGFLKPRCVTDSELAKCKELSEKLRANSDVFVVVGIGGSYLGAKAVAELLDKGEKLIFVGNTLSGRYYQDVTNALKDKDFSIIVISKSGGTLEPAIALRHFEKLLRERYGDTAKDRVVAITNPDGGALKELADSRGYQILSIPNDLQGRYSVLTMCGLLPLAVAGVDIDELLKGSEEFSDRDEENSLSYAAARQMLYSAGKKIEVVAVWEPNFRSLGAWQQQLFAESEGKDGKGMLPVTFEYSTDLHSLGQYMQDGERIPFETMLYATPTSTLTIPESPEDFDNFNIIAGRKFDEINQIAIRSTVSAHVAGGVPVIEIDIGDLTPYNIGKTLKFFMRSCGISGYIQGVHPFNQPGVEVYKSHMRDSFLKDRQ